MPIDLNVENFFWLQAAIVILGAAFLLWRPKNGGFTLRLGKPQLGAKGALPGASGNVPQRRAKAGPTRELQVFFNYNGHSFEAYEVFGLPAGSSLPKVEAAYREQLAAIDEESRPFLEAAFSALKAARN